MFWVFASGNNVSPGDKQQRMRMLGWLVYKCQPKKNPKCHGIVKRAPRICGFCVFSARFQLCLPCILIWPQVRRYSHRCHIWWAQQKHWPTFHPLVSEQWSPWRRLALTKRLAGGPPMTRREDTLVKAYTQVALSGYM